MSTEATLHEEDTTPLPIATPGAPATIAAPVRYALQTDAVAIRHRCSFASGRCAGPAGSHVASRDMVTAPFEEVLEQCGFAIAAGLLRVMFALEGVTDPRRRCELACDVIERTVAALKR